MPEETLNQILKITRKIISELNPRKLLEHIIDAAIELAEFEEGVLLLPDEKNNFKVHVARDRQGQAQNQMDYSARVVQQVIKTDEFYYSPKLLGKDEDGKDSKTIICMPLKGDKKILGIIYLATQSKDYLDKAVLSMVLETFAQQATIALENSLLFAKNKKKLDELKSLVQRKERQTQYSYDKIIGRSKEIEDVLKTIDKVTNVWVPVYIYGETGTGKELVARAIHENSERSKKSFVAINCTAFTETVLESELFGYYKGAFTGADRDRSGLIEQADEGTLFLDEIGDMSKSMQAKLLRVIQENEVLRIGGRTASKVQVKFLSASHVDLKKAVREGKFREDLYYRLAGITISIPALRDRKEDIPLLVDHIIEKFTKENSLEEKLKVSEQSMRILMSDDWPGNVRQLEQTLVNSFLLSGSTVVLPKHLILGEKLESSSAPSSLKNAENAVGLHLNKAMTQYQREIILKTLKICKGNKSEVARHLGLSRATVYNTLAKEKG